MSFGGKICEVLSSRPGDLIWQGRVRKLPPFHTPSPIFSEHDMCSKCVCHLVFAVLLPKKRRWGFLNIYIPYPYPAPNLHIRFQGSLISFPP